MEEAKAALAELVWIPSLEDANTKIYRGATTHLVKPVKTEELVRTIVEKIS